MNKIAKGFLFAGGGVMSAALLALIGLGLYVESAAVQGRLEAALSRELKMPVKASRIRLSPWGKLKVEGLMVAEGLDREGQVSPLEGGDVENAFFHAPLASAKLAWKPLMAGRLVIRELVISQPVVQWVQSDDGRWELPQLEEAAAKKAKKAARKKKKKKERPEAQVQVEKEERNDAGVPLSEKTALHGASAEEGAVAAEPKAVISKEADAKPVVEGKKQLEFQVVAARIEGASFRFFDRKRRPLALFEGVTFDCPSTSAHRAEGVASIRTLTLHDRVVLHDVATPYLYEGGVLSLPKVEAQLSGGKVSGYFLLHPEEQGAPFDVDVRFEGVDLARLLEEIRADLGGQKVQGVASGALKLGGESGHEKTIVGKGEVVLGNGRVEHNPLFQMIGQALQIEELLRLDLKESRLDFNVRNGRVYIEPLLIESENLSFRSEGNVRFNGKLDLESALAVNAKISRQFPKWLMGNFKALEGLDRQELRFKVRGTLDEPDTDLMRVLVGQRLERQALELIKVFRPASKGKKEKKEADEESGH